MDPQKICIGNHNESVEGATFLGEMNNVTVFSFYQHILPVSQGSLAFLLLFFFFLEYLVGTLYCFVSLSYFSDVKRTSLTTN